ncbi:MAG: prepilin-type N-terminal cleavage/methylation domain-containing protein [candidate division Zixibacteria bacterium]|nr:prepilin-type N-terminal cleavage/methylation domain-containing protein [candidate division Zixibacteria bacterium]
MTDQRGFSFLEVIISLAVMGVVTTAIFHLYVTQHKNYLTQENITVVQQNARAAIDELVRQVRMAGHQLPDPVPAIVASDGNPDTIVVSYVSADCDTYLADSMSSSSSELLCATDVSCFKEGQWVYIYEPDSGDGEWFPISQIDTAANGLRHDTQALSKAYAKDAIVIVLDEVRFFVDNSDPNQPNLMMQRRGQVAQVFAENVVDLQFQYRMKNGMIVDEPLYAGNIREILVRITGRTPTVDGEIVQPGECSTRTFSSSVFLRNLGV